MDVDVVMSDRRISVDYIGSTIEDNPKTGQVDKRNTSDCQQRIHLNKRTRQARKVQSSCST